MVYRGSLRTQRLNIIWLGVFFTWMLFGALNLTNPPLWGIFLYVGGMILFGAMILLALAQCLPSWNYLTLTPDGLQLTSMNKQRALIRWKDIATIEPTSGKLKGVGINLKNPAKKRLYGWDAFVGDTYNTQGEPLADILESWRRKYGN